MNLPNPSEVAKEIVQGFLTNLKQQELGAIIQADRSRLIAYLLENMPKNIKKIGVMEAYEDGLSDGRAYIIKAMERLLKEVGG